VLFLGGRRAALCGAAGVVGVEGGAILDLTSCAGWGAAITSAMLGGQSVVAVNEYRAGVYGTKIREARSLVLLPYLLSSEGGKTGYLSS
jgi:hypothetical protein